VQIFKRNGDVTSADTTDLKDGQKLRKEQTNGNAAVKLNFVIQVVVTCHFDGDGMRGLDILPTLLLWAFHFKEH
jgi:hypothetical protein